MSSRHEVLARLNAGDAVGAASMAREMLAARPENADVQGLLGLALEDTGDKEAAIAALRGAVALPAAPSIALRNTANLAAMLVAADLSEEAGALLQSGWSWLADVEIGDNERQCIILLADIMKGLELNEKLVELLLPIVERVSHQWGIVRRTAVALSAVGRHEDALALVEAVRPRADEEPDRQAILAYLHGQTGRPEKARAAMATFGRDAAPYVTPRRADQWFTIGVLNPLPSGKALLASEHSRHFRGNFPAQLATKLSTRYRFASVLLGAGPAAVERFRQHRARVLLNNVVNSELLLDGHTLAAAQALADASGLPLINPPQRAALCTRQLNYERFADTPNMLVPRLKRFNVLPGRIDEMVRLAEESFTYPLLVRTVTQHETKGLTLVEDQGSLRETILRFRQHAQIYLIQYAATKHHNGFYRKLRAAFVEGTPLVVRAEYNDHWLLMGRKFKRMQDFYKSNPDLLADANDIVVRPGARLGAEAMATLDAIGRAVPLDIFGLDFDVDDSGRIVFFEANPSMNLFSNTPAGFEYPPSADALLLERIERLLHARAEAGTASMKAAEPG